MRSDAIVLHTFRSLDPPYRGDQARTLEWLAAAHARAELTAAAPADEVEAERLVQRVRRRVLRYGSATQRIRYRLTCLEDFAHTEWDKMRIYSVSQDPAGARCGERNRVYAEIANDALERLYLDDERGPAVLLHVTCTGYASPSAAQRLVARRAWCADTEVLHLYHMGCYAALPGIRIAQGLACAGSRRVDLVHTELCTLHLDPAQHAAEQLVAQALFSDGIIRYSATPASTSPPGQAAGSKRACGLLLRATHEQLLPGTEGEMEWLLSDHGMQITLSRTVPDAIKPALPAFFERLAARAELDPRELRQRAIFAVHPGGPRIIDQVGAVLDLREEQLAASNAVLEARGNMSSATLPHIWQALLDDASVEVGTHVVALAFGPGLTISGAVLRKQALA